MTERVARGSLSGRWSARGDGRPNLRGAITLERGLPAGAKLWISGWTREAGGAEFVSLSVDVASGGPRTARRQRPDTNYEPEGRFSDRRVFTPNQSR